MWRFHNLFQCSVKHFMMLFSWLPTQDYRVHPRLSVGSSSIPRYSSMHTSCSVTKGNSFSSSSKPVLPKSLLEYSRSDSHVSVTPCLCDTKKIMACDSRQISRSSLLFPMLHACVQALPRATLVSSWVFSSQCPVGTPCFLAIVYKQLKWPCLTLFCWFCVPLHTHYPESFACLSCPHRTAGNSLPSPS